MNDYIPTQPAQVVHGLPPTGDLTSVTIDQSYPDTCAIRSQEIILRDFGINMTQDQLIQEANDHGWYSPGGGTSADDVGKLLELHGVGVTRYDHANVYNLVSDLSAGKRIIVGVDAGELWQPGMGEELRDLVVGESANHALIVAGVDTTDPNNVKVILTDPGTGHVAKEYPLTEFMDAWKDSGCTMISTNAPAPASAFGMVNFDYSSGHLPIGNVPYADWLSMHAHQLEPATYFSDDLDGDGVIDVEQLDTDGEGFRDAMLVDVDKDGLPDIAGIDSDCDGVLDSAVSMGYGTNEVRFASDSMADEIIDCSDLGAGSCDHADFG